MGSIRAKQGSYIEMLKAISVGALQGLTKNDRLLAPQVWNTLNRMEYDPDLGLYLPFDEASGQTAFDFSGNVNTGTATGTTVVDGVFGKCRSFDGVDDKVVCTGYKPTVTDGFSAEVWASTSTTGAIQFIFNQWGGCGAGNAAWVISFTSDGYPHFSVYDGSAGYSVDETSSYADGERHHYVLVYKSSVLYAYIDGKLYDSKAAAIQDSTAYDVFVGGQSSGAGLWTGLIDEPRLYTKALTADEVYLHYLAGVLELGITGGLRAKQGSFIDNLRAVQTGELQGLTRPDRLFVQHIWNTLGGQAYDPDLKLHLPLDEASGQTAHDITGNANTGTVTGTTITDGVFGKCRSFDGIDDFIDCGNDANWNIAGNLTLEAWIRTPDVFTPYGGIVGKYGPRVTYNGIALTFRTDDKLRVEVGKGGGARNYSCISDSVFSINTWYHVVGTRVGDIQSMYVNGVLQQATSDVAMATPTADSHVGRYYAEYDGYYFKGRIDEPRIYSRALSADEIYLHWITGAIKLGLI